MFDEIAQEVQAFVADYSTYYLSYIVEMTGANLSDAESNGRFLCDLSRKLTKYFLASSYDVKWWNPAI